MDDKPVENSDLIPPDAAQTKKLNAPKVDPRPVRVDEQNRFQIMPSNAISEDYAKRAKDAAAKDEKDKPAAKDAKRVTGDNYQQMYQGQQSDRGRQRTDFEEKKAQALAKYKAQEAANKLAYEKKQADNHRYRARELQNQIIWWQQQRGLGQYDDATIAGTVDQLQRELGAIPQMFW